LLAGAVKEMMAWPLPLTAVTPVGAPGTVEGVAAAEAVELVPVPEALIADILKVYPMPFVRPVKTKLVVAEPTFRTLVPITPVAADTPSDAKILTS
jgi:hypothetical protein